MNWFQVAGRIAVVGMVLFGAIRAAAEPSEYILYVSNERSGDVTVIDGMTDEVTATFPVGKRPRGIRCSPDGKTVLVALSGSPRMAPGVDRERPPADKSADGIGVIDRAEQKVVRKLSVGSDPEQFAFSKDGKLIVVANEDTATASIFDLAAGRVLSEVKVSEEPEGVTTNPVSGEVYVTCEEEGEVYVIDPLRRTALAHFAVGARPRSTAFLPNGARAYVPSEGEASISVVDTSKRAVVGTIKLEGTVMPMDAVVSPDGRELFVSTGRGNSIAVIETATDKPVASIPVGERVWGIALSPDGSKLYTANGASNDISVVDTKTRTELKRIKVGDGPWGIAVAPKL
jgi:YVTN family beta-propeller protein